MNKGMALISAAALFAASASAAEPDYSTLIGHRGESEDAPENTLPAYRLAADRGFGFECDVYLSRDGRVYTFHDPNLTRTSGGAIIVCEGGTECRLYMAERLLPNGTRHVFLSRLDVVSDTAEGVFLLDSILCAKGCAVRK